jgi:hypothetical protein
MVRHDIVDGRIGDEKAFYVIILRHFFKLIFPGGNGYRKFFEVFIRHDADFHFLGFHFITFNPFPL